MADDKRKYPLGNLKEIPAYIEMTVFQGKATYVEIVFLNEDGSFATSISSEKGAPDFNFVFKLAYEHIENAPTRGGNAPPPVWDVSAKFGKFGGIDYTITHTKWTLSLDAFFGRALDRPYGDRERKTWLKDYN